MKSATACICGRRLSVHRRFSFRPVNSVFLLFALIAAGAVAPLPARANEFSQKSAYSARLFTAGTLMIDTRMGDLRIDGWDRPRVEVEAEKVVVAGTEEKAKGLYEMVRIRLEGQDKQVRLSTIYPPRSLRRPFRGESNISVNFHIRMPYDANLTLHCVDGDVRIAGIAGSEQLFVHYGDVEIDVPDIYRVRSLEAHTWLGYVQSDLHGTSEDTAGFRPRISFHNSGGDQDILVKVHMGGVWVYRGEEHSDDYD